MPQLQPFAKGSHVPRGECVMSQWLLAFRLLGETCFSRWARRTPSYEIEIKVSLAIGNESFTCSEPDFPPIHIHMQQHSIIEIETENRK